MDSTTGPRAGEVIDLFAGPAGPCGRQGDLPAPQLALVGDARTGGRLPKGWTHKVCRRCDFIQPRSNFGTQAHCKSCRAAAYQANKDSIRVVRRRNYRANKDAAKAYSTAWKQRNPGLYADYNRKAKYGLAPGQYAQMLAAQGGLCAICRSPHPKSLHVDHCHASGVVRALLCDLCNRGLGYFRDEPERLDQAAAYLRRFK